MPELPEVETVRRGLADLVVGARIDRVEATGARTVRRAGAAALVAGATGRRLTAAGRRGKYLLLDLDDGCQLVIHLRMSGQVLVAREGEPRPTHTHVVLGLDDGREVRFVDPRTFGEVFVVDPDRLSPGDGGLAALGWDPVLDPVDRRAFDRLVRGRRKQLKHLLTDQHLVAGLGNIYSDEVLHRSGLRHDRSSDTLSAPAARRLHDTIVTVLDEAIAARGSSLSDQQYVDLHGQPGAFQHQHRVYGREGLPCLSCGRPIQRVRWAGRSTFFCPRCQR